MGTAAQVDCEVMLLDVSHAFSTVLTDLMVERGIDRTRFTDRELKQIVAECMRDCYRQGWEEFVLWVLHGDDRRAKTKEVLQTNMGRPTLFGLLTGRVAT